MDKKHPKKNVRQVNTSLVLNTLLQNDTQMSRPDLAEEVGLSKVTIASIIRTLNQVGFTTDAGMGLPDHRGGRKPVLVTLDKNNKRVISARLGHDQVEILLSDITGRELSRIRSTGENSGSPNEIGIMVKELVINGGTDFDSIVGLMITVDDQNKDNKGKFDEKSFCSELTQILNLETKVVDLTIARAFAQQWYGDEFNNPADFFYLDLDSDVQAVSAKNGILGDTLPGFGSCCLNHLPCGPQSSATATTTESILSGEAFLERIAEIHGRHLNFNEMLANVRAGDGYSLELLQQYGYQLGYVLSLAVNITSLQRVIIGGFMSEAWPFFDPMMHQGLNRHIHPDFRGQVTVAPLRKDLNDGLMGTLALALDEWVYQTNLLPLN